MKNFIDKVYEQLEEKGIVRDGYVDVTFIEGGAYSSPVMQYGHNLQLSDHTHALEREIGFDTLKVLEDKTFAAKTDWIRMNIYLILKYQKQVSPGFIEKSKVQLLELLSRIRNTSHLIIVDGESKDDHTVDLHQAAQTIGKKQ